MNNIAIFGYSGFALEVADICYSLGVESIVLLSNENNIQDEVNGFPIIAESEAYDLHRKGYSFAIGIGDSLLREKVFENYKEFRFPNIIHLSAVFGKNQREAVEKQQGNIITAGTIFTNSIKIGDFGLYNLKVTVGHDCIIDNFVSIMPNVTVSGNVHIQEGVFIGASATILQGSSEKKLIIGSFSKVGASSLVTKSVDSDVTVLGIPAKNLRK
jgi:sugar O-acyltransferase (sialic acid O-acetyltransferase NeuD family)